MDIAVLETSHLGKTMVTYGREASRQKTNGRLRGFSSHVHGSTVLRMSAVIGLDGDGVQGSAGRIAPTADGSDI